MPLLWNSFSDVATLHGMISSWNAQHSRMDCWTGNSELSFQFSFEKEAILIYAAISVAVCPAES